MLDLKFNSKNVEKVKRAIELKNDQAEVDNLIELDVDKRKILIKVEELKHQRNTVSEEIGKMKRQKQDASETIAKMRKVSNNIKELDEQVKRLDEQIYEISIRIPNIPHSSVPEGKDETANVEVKKWGVLPEIDFQPLPHWEVGEKLGIIDLAGGSKVSGSFFINYVGLGARLQRALISFMLDLHIEKHGYTEVYPPYIVNRESMFGTGQLPKIEEDIYHAAVDDLFIIPTDEVRDNNLFRDNG